MSSSQRVAHRYLAAKSEDEERFNDRLNEVPDLESAASNLVDALLPLKDIDDAPMMHAEALAKVISTASTVENESDLNANLKEALEVADDVRQALQSAKRHLKDTDDVGEDDRAAAQEAIADGMSQLRSLVSDIKNI